MTIHRETKPTPFGGNADIVHLVGHYSKKMGDVKRSVITAVNFNRGGGITIGGKDEDGNELVVMLDQESALELGQQLVTWMGGEGSMQA